MQAEEAAKQCRRVSNMTPEQLSRKRAIDRENQRYLRAKRNAHTRHLEEQITSLQQKLAEAEARIVALEKDRPQQLGPSRAAAATTPVPASAVDDPGLDLPAPVSMPLQLDPSITLDLTPDGDFLNFLNMDVNVDMGPDLDLPAAAPAGDWAVPVRHTPPTNRLDRFITGTVAAWRTARLSTRQSAELSAASQFPNVSALLNHPEDFDWPPQPGQQPLSSAVSAHLHGSPLQPLVERLGILYCLSHLVRWLVCLSRDTYDRMPAFLRPTPLQRAVPHPAWIDLVIFPAARDEMIRLRDWNRDRFEAYRAGTASSLSVNWPFADSGAVVESADDNDGEVTALNPIFEAHVRNLDNWTVSVQVAAAFPYMAPYVVRRRAAPAPPLALSRAYTAAYTKG